MPHALEPWSPCSTTEAATLRSLRATTKTQYRQIQINDINKSFKNVNNASKENMGQQGPLYSGGRREATDLSGGAEGGITCRLRAARGVPHCQGVPGARSVYFVSSSSVQFGSSVAWSFQTLCNRGLRHAGSPYPSPTPRACSNWCPLSWWCHPTISSSVIPFSCLQSCPTPESFLIS